MQGLISGRRNLFSRSYLLGDGSNKAGEGDKKGNTWQESTGN